MNPLIINGELVLYGTVGEIDWDVDYFAAVDVILALTQLSGDIVVRLNSPGGFTPEGIAIYNALKAYPGKVTIVVDGVALSAGSLIAMAGDTIIMNVGSLMMIHDPMVAIGGNAEDHQNAADQLNRLADTVAAIYAARAGITPEAARAIMQAETWYDAQEAVAAGFADEAAPTVSASTSLYDFRLYRNSPTSLVDLAVANATMFQPKAAPAAQPKENGMTLAELIALMAARLKAPAEDVTIMCNQAAGIGLDVKAIETLFAGATTMDAAKTTLRGKVAELVGLPTPTPVTPAPAATMTVADIREVYGRAATAGITLLDTNTIVATAANREAAFAAIIDRVAEMSASGGRAPNGTHQVTEDARDKFRAGAVLGLMAKTGHKEGQRNEFSGMSLVELAREAVMLGGGRSAHDVRRMDRMLMVGTAFTMAGAGLASTSDFAYILQNVAHKSALKGFQEAEETFQLWTSVGSASDFKPISRVDLGLFPALSQLTESGEYSYAKIGDRGVTVVIATYGKMIGINRQAIINDDLSLLGSLPVKMGRAAKRTIGNLVYAFVNSPPAWSDTVAFFHANHGNLAGALAAPSEATWQAAVIAMGKQQDNDKNAVALNIAPKYFLSSSYQFTAKQLLQSTGSVDNTKTAGVINTVQNLVTPITDQRITANTWYFAADPSQWDTLEVTYLDGIQEPVVESQNGWNIDGTELKIRMDAGVNPLDFRGFYKGQ